MSVTATKAQGETLMLRGETFTRTGYIQTGWSKDPDGSKKDYVLNATYTADASVTLYPYWTANTYSITYSLGSGGTHGSTHPTSATYDTAFYVSAPSRSGYTFAGWTVTSGLNTSTAKWGTGSSPSTAISSTSTKCVNGATGTVYFKNLTVTANGSVTLTASWTAAPTPTSYTVTYAPGAYGAGSSLMATKTQGTALSLRGVTFTRTGYTQTGWSRNSSGGTKDYNLGVSYTTDAAVTLYPYWTANTYSVAYSLGDGGTHGSTHPTSATYDTAFYVSAPTRAGYTFAGWTVTSGLNAATAKWGTTSSPTVTISSTSTKCVNGATGTVYFKNLTVTANGSVTLTASWTAAPTPTSYTVTYAPGAYGAGSSLMATKTQGTALSLRGVTFTRTGYTQTGWSRNSSGGTKDYNLSVLYTTDAAVTLYPYWTANTYSVAYSLGDGGTHGSTHPTSATYDTAFYVSAPTRAGYTFAGWTVTSGLNASTAKWGTTSSPTTAIGSTSTKCVNGATGSVYFKNLTANGSVTLTANWVSMDFELSGSTLVKYHGAGGEVIIPEIVTRIDSSAFEDCTSLTSVSIHEGVTYIGGFAFYNCRNLISVVLPKGLSFVNIYVFMGCSSLKTIVIPEGVTQINGYAFSRCSSLSSVTLPDTLQRIWNAAFEGCVSLTSVTIPSNVTEIDTRVFSGCKALSSILIPRSVTSIGASAFAECDSLSTVYVDQGCTQTVRGLLEASGLDVSGIRFVENKTITYAPGTYGSGSSVSEQKKGGVALMLKGALFTRIGYRQTGWSRNSSGGTKDFDLGVSYTTDAAVTLYPYWTANTYSITYALNSGTHGMKHPMSATYDVAFSVSAPKRAGYTFAGWSVTSGLNTSTAKWGTTSSPSTSISSTSTKCVNGATGSVYFKNLASTVTGSVTLTANWTYGETQAPDLKPQRRFEWVRPIVVSGTMQEYAGDTAFSEGCDLFVSWAVGCDDCDVSSKFYTSLYVDDGHVGRWCSDGLPKGYVAYIVDFGIGKLPVGNHVIRLVADADGDITESNEDNNEYELTITVVRTGVSIYSVTYAQGMYGTGSPLAVSKIGGEPINLMGATYTRTGYTQTGWSKNSSGSTKDYNLSVSYTTDAAVTLYPYWTANTYAVTYALNGGTHGSTHPTSATYDTAFYVSAPTRNGYMFVGWTVMSGLNTSTAMWGPPSSLWTSVSNSLMRCVNGATGAVYFKNLTAMAGGSVTLMANWDQLPTYSVSYDPGAYGVGSSQSVTKTQGVSLTLRGATFTRVGYTQTGWSKSASGSTKDYALSASYTVDAALTLYPYWTANTCSIRYVMNSGTHGLMHPTSATYDTMFYVSAPTRTGYTFAGWTVTSGLNASTAKWGATSSPTTAIPSSSTKCVNGVTGAVYFKNLTAVANGSVTLTANWTAIPTYSVSYSAGTYGTGSLPASAKMQGVNITLPGVAFTRTGYTQTGWSRNAGGSTKDFNLSGSYTMDAAVTLYPYWTANTYTIAYALGGGSHGSTHPASATYDTAFVVSAPTRSGYTFVGWTVTSGLDSSTAKWSTTSSPSTAISSSSTKCANGATGSVWFKNLTPTANGHVTLTANWILPSGCYAVQFVADEGAGTITPAIVRAGAVFALPPCTFAPPAGKRFAGWACSNGRRYDDGMLVFDLAKPGETVTMTAIWE